MISTTFKDKFEEFADTHVKDYDENWEYYIDKDDWLNALSEIDKQVESIVKDKDAYFLEMCEVIKKNENLSKRIAELEKWVSHTGEHADVCTYSILKTVCPGCKCQKKLT